MKRLFIQATMFKQRVSELDLSGELLRKIENEILNNPLVGSAIGGTGGVRKARLADDKRGK